MPIAVEKAYLQFTTRDRSRLPDIMSGTFIEELPSIVMVEGNS
jgi:hypothetical protein